jgi:signal transduction histidine kinase
MAKAGQGIEIVQNERDASGPAAKATDNRPLDLLYELSQELATTLNLRQVAGKALHLVLQALGATRGDVFLYEPAGNHLKLITAAGYPLNPLDLPEGEKNVKMGQGVVGHVALTRVALTLPDVSCDERWLPWPSEDGGNCSAAVIPLLAADGLVGLLDLIHDDIGFFSDGHLPLLRAVATPVALSLQNARLYEAEWRAHQIAETIRAAALALGESLEVNTVLEALLDYLSQLVPYDSACAMLMEGKTRLVVAALRGYERWTEPRLTKELAFEIAATPNLNTLFSRQHSLVISDTNTNSQWQKRPGGEHIRNWLGVPLLARGKFIGVVSLDKTEPNFFTVNHLRLAEALAAQAAVAIQNAQLFEQVSTGRALLRRLTHEVVSAQEEERQRISRELHDEAGQAMTALRLGLALLKKELPADPKLHQHMDEALDLTNDTMIQIRMLAQALRPPALDTLGLNNTLDGYCREFAARTGLEVEYSGQPLPNLTEALTISFYRLLQEALNNVARHAQATEVRVALQYDGATVSLVIEDNGRGFELRRRRRNRHSGGMGLVGMQERLELLGGRLDVDSQSGRGTRLVASIPWTESR